MWRVLSAHFAAIGAATSRGVTSEVALYAVDSLRQLSVKFLAKDEKARRRALELDVSKRFLFSSSSSSRLLHTSSRCLRLYCVASRDRGADGRCACVGVARPPYASRRLSVAFRLFLSTRTMCVTGRTPLMMRCFVSHPTHPHAPQDGFHFQRVFLRPFETVMAHSADPRIREVR
jgi:hypothetical protein